MTARQAKVVLGLPPTIQLRRQVGLIALHDAWKPRIVEARRAGNTELEIRLNQAKARLAPYCRLFGHCDGCGKPISKGARACQQCTNERRFHRKRIKARTRKVGPLDLWLADQTFRLVLKVLCWHRWNPQPAAKTLGISYATIYRIVSTGVKRFKVTQSTA